MNVYSQFMSNGFLLEPFHFRSECVMEANIVENPQLLKFKSDDEEPEILATQINLPGARGAGDGRLDIVALYDDNVIAVIEEKIANVGCDILCQQLSDYLGQKEAIFHSIANEDPERFREKTVQDFTWMGIAVLGNGDYDNAVIQRALEDGTLIGGEAFAVITLDRYRAEKMDNYIISRCYARQANHDYRKVLVNGVLYNKRKSVLAAVRTYCVRNPDLTIDGLRNAFPDRQCRTTGNVFTTREEAEGGDSTRWFMNDPIQLRDGTTVVVNNQWGGEIMDMLITQANRLGIDMRWAE